MMQDEQQFWPREGMATLSEVMLIAAGRGYTNEFKIGVHGLCIAGNAEYYAATDVHITNFYRFEGASSPDDMAVLYLVETTGGLKGTLVDAYGIYADSRTSEFVKAVQDIHKVTDH